MIKVNCKDGSEPVKEEYPCLKISKSKRIVAFTARQTGYELQGIPGDRATFLYSVSREPRFHHSYPGWF